MVGALSGFRVAIIIYTMLLPATKAVDGGRYPTPYALRSLSATSQKSTLAKVSIIGGALIRHPA